MLAATSLVIGLVAWGAHAVVPWSLPQAGKDQRKAWALAALPLLLASVIATMLRLRAAPDGAIEQGMSQAHGASLLATLTVLAAGLLVIADLLAFLASERFEEKSWTVAGAVGILALILVSLAGERLRIGIGPGTIGPAFFAAATVRMALAAAAGEALTSRRPLFAFWAGLLLPCYLLFLPASLRDAAIDQGLLWTSLAAGVLLLSARFIPTRWQRIVVLVAILIAAVWLTRISDLSNELGRIPMLTEPPMLPLR